ncbi:C40 family peptidase [Planosporangium sp. 12N6]|uniref:C40 family peptidase n=1 Tax=Planosporangium spinosum TaxID=3402278 RepID=UPI003CF0658F
MGRIVTCVAVAALALVVLVAAAAAGIIGAIAGTGAGVTCRATLANPGATPAGLTAEQTRNAGVIVAVGQRMAVPTRGWVIAVATALQESNLINSPVATDHDSVGLFQQRPSQGWGTVDQIMNPDYAATKFYERLVRVPGWQAMTLTDAAQAVQRSAYPDAYATHEARAAAIVAAYTGGITCDGGAGGPGGDLPSLPPDFTLPADTPPPVVVAIRWALGQLGTPYTFGGDCTAPHSGVPSHQCDCSSLMQQAYRAAGIGLPRTTHEQVHAGTPVGSLADVRPGDLILIPGSDGTRDDPGHVGMAIGSGLLVQAPQTGDVVKVSKLSGWVSEVAAIRRIVPQ